MRLLLASKSPRRRELLSQLGFTIDFVDIDVDERLSSPLPPSEVAEHLARRKADAYPAANLTADDVLVTADTVVVHNGRIMGKPRSRDEAIQMLHELSGDSHIVYTGVCLRSLTTDVSFTESTKVTFATVSDSDIEHYVDTYRPYDKAGAYGIQEWIGMIGISSIEGCYYNVMGLPLAALYDRLRKRFLSSLSSPRSSISLTTPSTPI